MNSAQKHLLQQRPTWRWLTHGRGCNRMMHEVMNSLSLRPRSCRGNERQRRIQRALSTTRARAPRMANPLQSFLDRPDACKHARSTRLGSGAMLNAILDARRYSRRSALSRRSCMPASTSSNRHRRSKHIRDHPYRTVRRRRRETAARTIGHPAELRGAVADSAPPCSSVGGPQPRAPITIGPRRAVANKAWDGEELE